MGIIILATAHPYCSCTFFNCRSTAWPARACYAYNFVTMKLMYVIIFRTNMKSV